MKLADIMTILGSIDIIMGEKEKYPHRYNNVLDIYWCFFMDCDFNKKSHFLRTRKRLEIGGNDQAVLSSDSGLEYCYNDSSTSKYGFFGWNLWRQPIGFLVIKPNILVLNMVYFILFLT
ncbi:hypothetical protein ACJX0J_004509 [Zea mays]